MGWVVVCVMVKKILQITVQKCRIALNDNGKKIKLYRNHYKLYLIYCMRSDALSATF